MRMSGASSPPARRPRRPPRPTPSAVRSARTTATRPRRRPLPRPPHPRAVRTHKENAQRAFRAASKAAGSPDAVEAAARTWLQEINRINREAAAASLSAERERELAASTAATLERLSVAADAARVGASMAEAACVAARTAVADCDERSQRGRHGAQDGPTATAGRAGPLGRSRGRSPRGRLPERDRATDLPTPPRRSGCDGDPRRPSLGGDDPEERARWKVALVDLLDAILADAIEQAYLRFPPDHPFWGPYTLEQNRDITRALASLGYRPDGLGGWVDDRLPSQRELSLALGYAGLDPMRVRQWPNEQQTAALFREVEVAGDEYVAGVAGDLTAS